MSETSLNDSVFNTINDVPSTNDRVRALVQGNEYNNRFMQSQPRNTRSPARPRPVMNVNKTNLDTILWRQLFGRS